MERCERCNEYPSIITGGHRCFLFACKIVDDKNEEHESEEIWALHDKDAAAKHVDKWDQEWNDRELVTNEGSAKVEISRNGKTRTFDVHAWWDPVYIADVSKD